MDQKVTQKISTVTPLWCINDDFLNARDDMVCEMAKVASCDVTHLIFIGQLYIMQVFIEV